MNNDELNALARMIEIGILVSEAIPFHSRGQYLEDLQVLAEYGKIQSKRNSIKVVK